MCKTIFFLLILFLNAFKKVKNKGEVEESSWWSSRPEGNKWCFPYFKNSIIPWSFHPIIDVNQCIEKRIFFLSHSFINCGHLFLTKTEIFVLLHQEIKFQQCEPPTNWVKLTNIYPKHKGINNTANTKKTWMDSLVISNDIMLGRHTCFNTKLWLWHWQAISQSSRKWHY